MIFKVSDVKKITYKLTTLNACTSPVPSFQTDECFEKAT